jgi:hypothetical protein
LCDILFVVAIVALASLIVMLPLLLVQLLLLQLHQRLCCNCIVTIVALSSLIIYESTTAATTTVWQGLLVQVQQQQRCQQQRWHGVPKPMPLLHCSFVVIAPASLIAKESATTATMPVKQGHWHGRNNNKDVSNRGNTTRKNQLAQQKDERADKRSGAKDATQGNRAADYTTRGGGWKCEARTLWCPPPAPDNIWIGTRYDLNLYIYIIVAVATAPMPLLQWHCYHCCAVIYNYLMHNGGNNNSATRASVQVQQQQRVQ